jgi:hypothetical protein
MGNYQSDRIPNKSRPMWKYIGERPSHILGKVRRMVALILDGPASRPLSKRAGLSRTYASVAVR